VASRLLRRRGLLLLLVMVGVMRLLVRAKDSFDQFAG
jgi:hypothetical protein